MSVQQETATFLTRSMPAVTNTPSNPLYSAVLTGTSELKDFCMRPVEIANITPSGTFTPWDTWFANSAVAAKMRNYYLVRGVMNMRFLINAQPFWYGRTLIYLKPNSFTTANNTTFDKYSAYSSDYKCEIDYSVNQSVELAIPYMNPKPFAINSGVVSTNVTFAIDNLFGPYDAQSGGSVSPTVRVYCWVTDLELGIPIAQSGMEIVNMASNMMSNVVPPEQRNGAISGPVTAMSQFANNFKDIPIIGGIASAASGIANIAGGFASLLGLSKPASLKEPEIFIYKTGTNLALCEGKDTTYKLTIDPKHEKSVDPTSVSGAKTDPLAFSNILARPSIFTPLSIATSTTAGTQIFKLRVHPGAAMVSSNKWQLLPLNLAALAFSKWSGSIKIKVSIVCSRYHRGRLSLCWNISDPTESVSNVTNVKYLEITPGAEVEYVVPYAGTTPTLNTCIFDYSDNTTVTGFNNGFFYIYVDQVITAPAAAPIGIIVSMYAGDDFTVGAPTGSTLKYARTQAYQATYNGITPLAYATNLWQTVTTGYYTPVVQYQSGSSKVAVQESSLLKTNPKPSDSVTRDVFGEGIYSFRPLLKRYNLLTQSTTALVGSSSTNYLWRIRHMPCQSCQVIGGVSAYATNTTLFQILMACFAFYSGGTRHKFVFSSNNSLGSFRLITLRGTYGTYGSGYDKVTKANVDCTETQLNLNTSGGCTVNDGISMTEFEIPDMSGLRIQTCNDMLDITTNTQCADVILQLGVGSTANLAANPLQLFFAASDDFSFYVWVGIPNIWFYMPDNV